MTTEEWRSTTVGAYEVSSIGRVRNGAGRVLKPWSHRSGHLYLKLGRRVHYQVHRLVLQAFGEPRPAGTECLHIDGDPTNNRADNLRWGTRRENIVDLIRHTGRSAAAHLTYDQAAEIRRAYDGKHGSKARLARQYGISQTGVGRLLSGRNYTVAL